MGSGKSTTMRFIAKRLQDAGRAALPIHERTDPHPVRATDELEHWFEPWRDATPQNLAKVIAPLNPFVLYFWQEDVEEAVRMVCAERGPEWIDYQVNWKLAAPYCVRKGFAGLDGLISLYREYRQLTDDLFSELPLTKLAIENSRRDWPTYNRQILRELGLPTE